MPEENNLGQQNQQNQQPLTPEQEAALANQKMAPQKPLKSSPASSPTSSVSAVPASSAPKKIGVEKKQKSKARFLIGCSGAFLFLFILFIVLMILMLSQTGTANPVMQSFGLNPGGLRAFLLGLVGFSFGLFALLFLTLTVIGIFRVVNANKGDKEAKKRGTRMIVFSAMPLVGVLFLWLLLYSFILRIRIDAERVLAEIVILQPEDISYLVAPLDIRFTADNVAKNLQAGGLTIESMDWDLDGDGQYETPVRQAEITRLYTLRGNYTVGLRVSVAGEEESRIYEKSFVIQEATFAAIPSVGIAPLAINFDATPLIPSDLKVKSMEWDFEDDGTYEVTGKDEMKTNHTFTQIGVYRVHLRVIDEQNNVENYYRDIEVVSSTSPIVTANIQAVPGFRGMIPFQVRFDASQSRSLKGSIISYEWDFGDGSGLQSGKSISYLFNDPGTRRITLTVRDDMGNVGTVTEEVDVASVSSGPLADFKTTPAYDVESGSLQGVLPFKVEFDASSSSDPDNDIVDYQWDFDGDGVIDQEGKKATHTFEEADTYEVSLKLADSEGQENTKVLIVNVNEPGVQAVIGADPQEGTAPLIVEFDGSSSSTFQGKIVSYEWDFGDGSPRTITGASVSHKYNQVGTYTVHLKVLTSQNQSAESSQVIYVREVPLKACFTPSRSSGNAPLTVTFDTLCSTGTVAAYKWHFGDGQESDNRKPSYTFEHPGAYTVTLEVTDDKNNVSQYSQIIVAEGQVQ